MPQNISVESFVLAKKGDWNRLIEISREWFRANCPDYRSDEVELTVGTFVSQLVIRSAQLEKRIVDGDHDGAFRPRKPFTRQQADADLIGNIEGFWSDQPWIYQRVMRRVNNPVMAEFKLAETLRNLSFQMAEDQLDPRKA